MQKNLHKTLKLCVLSSEKANLNTFQETLKHKEKGKENGILLYIYLKKSYMQNENFLYGIQRCKKRKNNRVLTIFVKKQKYMV